MSRSDRGSRCAGFTLLEVLVALLVLALALVALTRTAAQQTAAFGALRDRSLAGWVAANALTELRLEPGFPAIGRREGQAEMGTRAWRYAITISDTPANGIRRVRVEVFEPDQRSLDDTSVLVSMHGFVGNSVSP